MQVSIAQELKNIPGSPRGQLRGSMPEDGDFMQSFCPKSWDCTPTSTAILAACQLSYGVPVVCTDTAIHDRRWSREEAITYLMDNSPTDREKATEAIERYLVLPSQATRTHWACSKSLFAAISQDQIGQAV